MLNYFMLNHGTAKLSTHTVQVHYFDFSPHAVISHLKNYILIFFPFESHLIFQQIQVEVQLGRFYTYNVQFRKALRLEERFCPQDVSSRRAFLLQDALSIKEYMTYNFTTQYLFICNRNMWLVKRGYKPYSNYKFCYSNPPPPPRLSATIQ